MAITFEYNNEFGKQITEQQFQGLENKFLVYKENNVITKKEEIQDDVVISVEYYISVGDSHSSILEMNNDAGILEIEEVNGYLKETGYKYLSGVLVSKSLAVANKNNETIFVQEIDIKTNSPIIKTLRKYYYDNLNQVEYEFSYQIDGTDLLYIHATSNEYGDITWRSSEISAIPNFEWWKEHSTYYLKATPMIPA